MYIYIYIYIHVYIIYYGSIQKAAESPNTMYVSGDTLYLAGTDWTRACYSRSDNNHINNNNTDNI